MKKRLIYLILICSQLGMCSLFAQKPIAKGSDVTIGKSYNFQPKNIPGNWEVQIALPPGYDSSADVYPVVYVLHGNFYFNYAVGGLQRLMELGHIPEVIIAGISNESNPHFAFGSAEADQFLDFTEKEIIPFVEQKFRTHADRTVMGWHYTSGFIFHSLVHRPHLFKNYLPVSPYLQGYNVSDISFNTLEQLSVSQPDLKKHLYFGVLSNERSVTEAALSLDTLLKRKAPSNLEWSFDLFEPDYSEVMEISVYRLWQVGLKTVYASYQSGGLNYATLREFLDAGGLPALKKHYAQRAIAYGGSSQPLNLISLARLAKRADDFQTFDELLQAFGSDFKAVNRNRVMEFAAFYLKHNKAEKAIDVYKSIDGFYPNSVRVHKALAEAYIVSGKTKKARESYKKAIVLARSQSSEQRAELERKLAELK